MTDRQRFLSLLPFMANGTLSAQDREFVNGYLAAFPELQAEVNFHEQLRGRVCERVESSVAGATPSVGLAQALSLIERDQAAKQGAGSRLARWFGNAQWWRGAPALACGLVIGWVSMFASLEHGPTPPPGTTRSTGVPDATGRDGPAPALLRVNFDPNASEKDIRMALIEARAVILAGPTKLGDYYVQAAPGQLEAARHVLERHRAVVQVTEANAVPEDLFK